MKIQKETINRITIGFPAEWECESEDGEHVLLSYRHGRIKVIVNGEHKETISGPEGDFDVGGSCEDEDLIKVLQQEELLAEKE